jgi:hypothetical protein
VVPHPLLLPRLGWLLPLLQHLRHPLLRLWVWLACHQR